MTDTSDDRERTTGVATDEVATPDPARDDGNEAARTADTDTSDGNDGEVTQDPLARLAEERDTYLDLLRRERAEFENFRRRSQRERTEALDRGAQALIAQLLGVLDNFGYVLEAAKDADDAVAKGVRMVHSELREVLERAGLEDVPGVGAEFDPTWHDAVMQVEGDGTDDGEPKVAQVLRTGYRFKGRVLRPASVAVSQ